ncbi:MAG: efflux RND transporter permease subunit [bacterium]
MRLPKYSIENHQFTIVGILLLVIIGIVSFFTMPRSEDPQVSPPGTSIIVVYPGANPQDMEELIVDRIEEKLNELDDIKEINSYMSDGLSVVGIEFSAGSDPEKKYSDVVEKVNTIKNELPADIFRLDFVKWEILDVVILQGALVSQNESYRELEEEAELLKNELESVAGVRKIQIMAYPKQEVRISVDIEKLTKMNLSLNQVMQVIQSNNANIPGGNIDIGSKRFNLKTSGSYQSVDEIRNTILDAKGGKVVFLKDVADVNLSYEDSKYFARFNKEKAVFITATQKAGTNIYDVINGINEKIKDYRKTLPNSIKFEKVLDQTESVTHRLDNFFTNLLQGLILVGIVLLLAEGIRASIIAMIAIPLSIFIGIGFLDIIGYGMEQMTITGLVIALGMLVDNVIVVTQNILRYMKLGFGKMEAAIKGTSEVGWAVVNATATTILAFVPIMMMQGVTGDFIRSMPTIVVFTLAASLLIALTTTPYMSSKILKVSNGAKETRFRKYLDKFIINKYRPALNFSLQKPKLIMLIAILIFLGSLSLFPLIGVSFFPKSDKPQFVIDIEMPQGTSLDKTNEVTKNIESILSRKEFVRNYAANIGKGNPRIYYNLPTKNERSNYAQIFVQLKEYDAEQLTITVDELRNEFKDFPGGTIIIKTFEQGPPVEAPIAIRLLGDELTVLKKIAADVEKIFDATENVINVDNPLRTSKADLHLSINRAKAGMLGVPIFEIDKTVRAAVAGMNVSTYRDAAGKEYDIVVRLPVEEKTKLEDLNKIYVSSVLGAHVPLAQLITVQFKSSPIEINHYNLDRNVLITADVKEGGSVDAATKAIIQQLDNYEWPKGYRYYVSGELESREESFGGMSKAILIAVIGIFAVLVLQFRSYTQPLIVFSAIPLAITGSILALLVTGNTFSFTAFIGITSLVGIVVNNSIILVDFINKLRKEGVDTIEAIIQSGETRFVPIFLTTATTIGGLIPLALAGGDLWAPLGWTIIGGLALSTVLTLLIVPVLYKLYSK